MTFPVTESTLSADQLNLYLQEKYHLGKAAKCSLLRTGMNHLYLVDDPEHSIKYVFRVYSYGWRSRTEISEELRLLELLKENTIPVSFPIVDKQQSYIQELQAPEGLRYGVLFSFAMGIKIPLFSPEASYTIGRTMAQMHRATYQFGIDRIHYDATTLLHQPVQRIHQFFNQPSQEKEFLTRIADSLQTEFATFRQMELRTGAVHMDIWFDNLHIENDQTLTIFDFDFAGNGWLCLDIAYFSYQLFQTNLDLDLFQNKMDQFLQGYESVHRLSNDEKKIIPILSLGIMVFYLGIQCQTFNTWSNVFLNHGHLIRYTNGMKRWINHHQLKSMM
ncbi:Ser/Thr protein kinase RdoA (MazF antagonist) [Dyadobacter jejuensis]|uniref:Ser/Thr protein kinase RdoA (MazF antagonist) n=1 Tax=Dyadobacter jejuensis TaxID=1082580 RepID=A0A316AMH8_9BACT|nr:phosphotransferase [Dyadobacter jejuensis]PWJ58943.1 Ser/Thr protein kinase RdoA (MazF antagonist) [Dyadobacter jejuensis]